MDASERAPHAMAKMMGMARRMGNGDAMTGRTGRWRAARSRWSARRHDSPISPKPTPKASTASSSICRTRIDFAGRSAVERQEIFDATVNDYLNGVSRNRGCSPREGAHVR